MNTTFIQKPLDETQYPTLNQLRQLFDCSPDLICSVDAAGNFLQVNNAATAILGYQPAEMIGRSYLDFVIPAHREATIGMGKQVIAGRVVTCYENYHQHKNGSAVPIAWSARWDDTERVLFCIGRNMAEKKANEALQAQLEQQVSQRNHELLEMLEHITDGFFALDNNWRFLYGNKQVENIVQVRREDYIGRYYLDCFPEMADIVHAQYEYAVAHNTPVAFEAFFPRFSQWFSINAHPSPMGLSVFFRDVTAQRHQASQRHAYEQQIKEQNRKLADVLERMNQGFISVDREMRVLYFNREAETILRISRDAILGQSLVNWYCPEAQGFYRPLFEQVLHQRCPIHSEHICPQNLRWVSVDIFPSGTGFSILFKDVHDRRLADDELRRLSLIAQETVNNVLITDLTNQVIWVNDAFTRNTGFSLAEVVGRRPAEVLSGPGTDEATIAYIMGQQEQGLPYHVEVLGYKKSGIPFWSEVYGQPIFDAAGHLQQYFSIETDITQRKRTEEELRRLSLVAQQTDNIVALTKGDNRIAWVNDAFTRITGYSFDEAVGRLSTEVFDGPETDPDVIRYVQEQWRQQQPFHIQALNYRKDGTTYWADITCQPVFDEHGKLLHFFSIGTDITERRRLQQVLDEEKQRRQQLVTTAAIAAQERERAQVGRELHDNVNQVLTTVKLYQELCLSGIAQRDELTQKSMELLQATINEIRNLSKRLSAPTLGNIKLRESVRELTDAVDATNKINIELDTQGIDDLEVEQELHLALYRILQEHLTNVLKHAQAGKVGVSFQRKGRALLMRVVDDGRGFDPKAKRSGIGIVNMTSRAESVGGKLTLNSAPGGGCVLLVQVPMGSAAG